MPLDTALVGANIRNIYLLGDPNTASSIQGVIVFGDATSLSGLYGSLVQDVPILKNSGGTYDQQRSAIGTLGIPAINTEGTKTTYSAATIGLGPAATATDFWQLVGSGTKTARLLRLVISGTATAAATVDIQLIKRLTANTGGTSSQPTIGQHDSNDVAPTCVVNLYSANPAGLGNSGGVIGAEKLNLGAAGSAGRIEWVFSNRNDKALVVRGVAQSYCLNWNGAAVPGGTSITIQADFTEE